jgi:hydroxypyruvate reductase
MSRALALPTLGERLMSAPVHVIAVGKAAPAMTTALLERPDVTVSSALVIGTHRSSTLPDHVDYLEAGHPYPDARSLEAGRRARERAERLAPDEHLLLLVSGGASALMAAPISGVSLDDKQAATRALMLQGADIHELNALRRHLSSVKGGRLAAACRGRVTTCALSDVVGDDLHVIGSGPGVADPSSWNDVADVLTRRQAWPLMPRSVTRAIEDGVAGRIPDTPKPGDVAIAQADGAVVGRAADAVESAADAARAAGYVPIILPGRVTGEARRSAHDWWTAATAVARAHGGRVCVLSSGETTVTVTGTGRGGRNLEFVLALVERLAEMPGTLVASLGTDGVDGSSGVAGAWADSTTQSHAEARGLQAPDHYLTANDSLRYFEPLSQVIRIGPTDTNVGDLQVLLVHA